MNMLVKMGTIDFNRYKHGWNYSHENEWFTSKYLSCNWSVFFYWVQICSMSILIENFIRKDNEKNMLVIILSCKYVDENIIIKFKMNSLWKDHSSKILWFVVSSFSIDKWRVSFLYGDFIDWCSNFGWPCYSIS
jgi:hypothetical protein